MPLGDSFDMVLHGARAGQEWAFSILYREMNAPLIRYFASRAPRDAEDLAAETWLGAARALASFSGDESAFRAWMFTIAHRRLVQHWRDQARHLPTEHRIDADRPAGSDVESDAVELVSAQRAAQAIAAALSPEQAEVILLRVLGGLDVAQVAQILGKRPGAVRALQHKALRKLAASSSFSSEVLTL